MEKLAADCTKTVGKKITKYKSKTKLKSKQKNKNKTAKSSSMHQNLLPETVSNIRKILRMSNMHTCIFSTGHFFCMLSEKKNLNQKSESLS